uniref:DAC domain-containing protein n=1 Tax=Ditylenchus dipsaci TaxID=166011 RepID=A0A915EL35_9BILA
MAVLEINCMTDNCSNEAVIDINEDPPLILEQFFSVRASYSPGLLLTLIKAPPFKEDEKSYIYVVTSTLTIYAQGISQEDGFKNEYWPEIITDKDKPDDIKEFFNSLEKGIDWPSVIKPRADRFLKEGKSPGLMDNEKLSLFISQLVMKVLFDLSSNGISALMIIDPQKDDQKIFESLLKNAIALNADFSANLLYAIFDESTPLHDLSVNVRIYPAINKVTIHSASIKLPMADDEEVIREFGRMTIGPKGHVTGQLLEAANCLNMPLL